MKKHSYAEMREELQRLLHELQGEDLDIDDALIKYERGRTLISELETYLKTIENKITVRRIEGGQTSD